jgi:hypothetical protein
MSEPPEKAKNALLEKGLRLAMWISFYPLYALLSIYGLAILYYFQNGRWVEQLVSYIPQEPVWLVSILNFPSSFPGVLLGLAWFAIGGAFALAALFHPKPFGKLAFRYLVPSLVAWFLCFGAPGSALSWWLD